MDDHLTPLGGAEGRCARCAPFQGVSIGLGGDGRRDVGEKGLRAAGSLGGCLDDGPEWVTCPFGEVGELSLSQALFRDERHSANAQ